MDADSLISVLGPVGGRPVDHKYDIFSIIPYIFLDFLIFKHKAPKYNVILDHRQLVNNPHLLIPENNDNMSYNCFSENWIGSQEMFYFFLMTANYILQYFQCFFF